jgi:hypothetical protein
MNSRSSSIGGLLLVAASFLGSVPIQAQTVQEWVELAMSNAAQARKSLDMVYSSALNKTVNHYREKGNNARADVVLNLKPNIKEIMGRISLAQSTKPEADIVD